MGGCWGVAGRLIGEGMVVPHPVRVGEGGLGGVVTGVTDVGTGKVSGVKLVYRVKETGDVGADGEEGEGRG